MRQLLTPKTKKNIADFVNGMYFSTIGMIIDAPRILTSIPTQEGVLDNYRNVNKAWLYGKMTGIVLDIGLIGAIGYSYIRSFGGNN